MQSKHGEVLTETEALDLGVLFCGNAWERRSHTFLESLLARERVPTVFWPEEENVIQYFHYRSDNYAAYSL